MDIKILKDSGRPEKLGAYSDTYKLTYDHDTAALIPPRGCIIFKSDFIGLLPSDGVALITGDSALWVDSGLYMGAQLIPGGQASKLNLRFQNLTDKDAVIYPGDCLALINFMRTEGASFTEYSNL